MSESSSQRDLGPFYVPGAIVIAGVIIGISLIIAFGGSNTAQVGGQPNQVAVDIEDVQLEGHPYIGEADAPVAIAYWSDYQCPYCKAVEVGHEQIPTPPAIPDIIRDYVNTGKVKIVFKDFAFLGPDSTTAALYARAVWDLYPTKFWEWREAMFKAQDEEHGGFGDEASIVTLTRGISGIDADAVKASIASKSAEYQAIIDADKAEAMSFGIQGTPGFIVGKTVLPGAVPFDQFKAAIDPLL